MTAQSRETKVLVALLISIIVCTIFLNMLGHNPPAAGAFCLSRYNNLVPVENLVRSLIVRHPRYWKRIEICFSECDSDVRYISGSNMSVDNNSSSNNSSNQADSNCHFIIYNGLSGEDRRRIEDQAKSVSPNSNYFMTYRKQGLSAPRDVK